MLRPCACKHYLSLPADSRGRRCGKLWREVDVVREEEEVRGDDVRVVRMDAVEEMGAWPSGHNRGRRNDAGRGEAEGLSGSEGHDGDKGGRGEGT